MKTILYLNTENLIAGMTMKDEAAPEANNMALHACTAPERVTENRRKLATSLGSELNDFVLANQTHSANFHRVTSQDKGKGAIDTEQALADTDALYTYEPDLLLGSFTADCVPVMFYSKTSSLTGVIHSGWQGTVKEITLKLFDHLRINEQIDPADIHIQIGAALSQEKFEVDEDVYVKYKNLGYADDFMYYNDQTGKYHIDNQLTVKKQCELAGIPAGQIAVDRTCTFTDPSGFSYRQDKQSGRHLCFIKRKST
ncbi:peptidoglycan editing factor PgeF [Planococcus lenghuensis]|uniref:Purine nucleoside phosphorylase n=1 Tax=Planococcus lenghuensis TaxID=2213202 RepID=A0A1Q2L375_9BACL|nr:peptidoglycan editing factor PgeF [Planococcus lenghuensis]AQQ54866.1 laccase [Planococcus lenghuensis]